MKKVNIYNLLLIPFIFVFFWYIVPIIILYFNPSLTQKPLILVTGDFTTTESFGSTVMKGVNEAKSSLSTLELISTEKYELIEYTEADLSVGFIAEKTDALNKKIRNDLVTLIAHKNIIGIIAANTSETIEPVLQVGKEFNIPVLITVASNDDIITNYKDISFRLLANDGKQGLVISKWCRSKLVDNNSNKIGVLYSQTRYGKGLRRILENVIGINSLVPFSLGTTTDIAGSFNYGVESGVGAWVVVTYKEEAAEIAVKKESLNIKGSVLYSDGAYGSWLKKIKADSLYYSFPTAEFTDTIVGYNHFGFDAYKIIYNAFVKYKFEKLKSKEDMLNIIKDPDFTMWIKQLKGQYRFKDGENEFSKFKLFKTYYESK